ncbi:MAG: GAF domain-containing protein, partial [Anaerolineae bacterium]|nr:GAF domain-containing protein [Anaerolineae bacterium]
MIEPLERLFHVPGRVFVTDAFGDPWYGQKSCADPAVCLSIIVDNEELGIVGICGSDVRIDYEEVVHYLAHTLSLLATETSRRRRMADEVLERYDELNLIYDLAALIARHNMSLDDIMRAVLEETNRILRAESGVIYIYDEPRSELIPISHFGRRSDEQFWQGRTRELALSTLYAYDTTQLFEGGRVICAPLRYDEERLGALVLMHEAASRTFSANDVNLLTTLAYNTALFIRAARLFDSLNQQNRELELTLAELQSTRDELSRAERLSIIGQIV